MTTANADQIDYWNETAGPTWVELQDRLDRQLEPLGLAALAALNPAPAERVLDIGCGCGQSTLALAERSGESGRVLGIDISEPMLAVAKRRLAAAGAKAEVLHADAQTHAFESQSFDAAFSRFGVMFFADPAAAFINIKRALKPGGRLVFVCWRAFQENPWMGLPMAAAAPFLPPAAPPDPLAPGPFAFADAERVRGALSKAGFADITVNPHDQKIGSGDLETTLGLALRVGPLGTALREHPEVKDKAIDAIRVALKPHETPAGLLLPSATWIVTARA
jgi:SAM-dependent methyltransferase